MSTLVVLFPQRARLRASSAGAAPDGSGRSTEYDFVLTSDGLVPASTGRCVAALLPKSGTVVGVVGDSDASWHRIALPKAPAGRLKAALVGVLEDALLEEADDVHLAVAPAAVPGAPAWIAAVSRRWLRGELAALEQAEVFVDRVVPMSWPDDPPLGHFTETAAATGEAAGGVALVWAHADGVANIPLQGALARALVPSPPPAGTRWTATPGTAAVAEAWLGGSVAVLPPAERGLQAARSLWNLRQFELARRTRSGRALRDSARRFFSPEWRPVRLGVAAFVAAQILGLNLWAWHQRGAIDARRATVQALVQTAYPNASAQDIQRDAAAVMQREAQTLRTLAGKPGETDLEPMLQAAAAAWPADRAPVDTLRFEPGKLTVGAAGWSPEQVAQFRSALRAAGWQVDAAEGRLTLTPGAVCRGGVVTPHAGRMPAPVAGFQQRALGWWNARLKRERQALGLLAAVVGVFVVWSVLVAPAWRVAVAAPAQLDRLDVELQQMQRTAAESQSLRATAPVPPAQAAQALKAATDRLGERGKLTQRGDRATLNFTNLGTEALRAWLAEARSGARARPVEAQWQRGPTGYSGSLVVSLGSGS